MKPVPDDIRRFVLTSIPSVPYLEAVLLLRDAPERAWTVPEVAARLYVPVRAAGELLEALCTAGLVNCNTEGTRVYQYAPRDESLTLMMDALAACYRENLFGVTALIHDAIQKNAVRFADAFKLRKDPE
jgi:hypothetical protein